MNRYEPKTPRAAFAVAALAMSTLTMAVLVNAPASIDTSSSVLASTRTEDVASRIEVVASRHDMLMLANANMPHVDR